MNHQSLKLPTLLLVLCVIVYAQRDPSKGLHCKHEELPDTLDSLSYLNLNEEFHLHGVFYANFSTPDKQITFRVSKTSAFRVYMAPHDVDLDLWLYNSTGNAVAYSSLNIGTEEVIKITLRPDTYRLKINFFGYWNGYEASECDTVTTEISLVPTDVLSGRVGNFNCPSKENFPTINFASLEGGNPLHYNSDVNETSTVMNSKSQSSNNRDEIRWIMGYNFTLPPSRVSSSLWEIKASLGYDYLTGNSLGLLLTPKGLAPNPLCSVSGNCSVAVGVRKNEKDLRTALTAGNYTLWLYDHVGERDSSLAPCTPFSLKLSLELQEVDQSPITCMAVRLPDRILPGLYEEPPGALHFQERVLMDPNQGDRVIGFHLDEVSYFRVFTAVHRVDIDLSVTNASGLVDATYNWNGEEGMSILLYPGDYNLTITFFGIYSYKFCETFEVEIATYPKAVYLDVCQTSSSAPAHPDLSSLPNALTTGNKSFALAPETKYRFNYEGDHGQRVIYEKNFVLVTPSTLNAEIGSDFLMGDMQVRVYDHNLRESPVYIGQHLRDTSLLALSLDTGNYTVAILTGKNQRSQLPHLPACAEYTFSLRITPKDIAGECWMHRRLPSTMNSPQYMGGRGVTHFHQEFLVPLNHSQVYAMEPIEFTVPKESFFRVWTEAIKIIDIDFYLYENGTFANRSVSSRDEEVIIWILKPSTTYQLQVLYYNFGSPDPHKKLPPCYLFDLQLAITPITPNPPVCHSDLPPSTLIPSYQPGSPGFSFQGSFSFQQGTRSLFHRLPFTVTGGMIYFRAIIHYDFVWSDISMVLTSNTTNSVWGVNGYNRDDLKTTSLGPGSYELFIYEPALMLMPQFRRCAHFNLSIYYEASTNRTEGLTSCPDTSMPTTLNTIAHLSPLSGEQVHIQRNFLVNVEERKDMMDFKLKEWSLFRMWIPYHGVIDIDVVLRNGTSKNPGDSIARNSGIDEEAMRVILAPGEYNLATPYYGYQGGALPDRSECAFFPAELSITPLSYLRSNNRLTRTCTTSTLPTTLPIDQAGQELYNRALNEPLNKVINFTLQVPALFDFHVRFDFPSHGLALKLQGEIDAGLPSAINHTYYSPIGYNHAYLKRVLPIGTYSLRIHDPFTVESRDADLKCGEYSVSYLINTTGIPADYCDDSRQLPTDLYSVAGGSAPYGGPQNSVDGSIRFFGEDFVVPNNNGLGSDHYMLFKINKPSFIRVFAKTETMDVDFFMYRNASRDPDSLIPGGHSTGSENIESNIIFLTPQDNPYLLELSFRAITSRCASLYLELEIATEETVREELTCPLVLPDPEVPKNLYDVTEDIWEYGEEYVFTKERIDSNKFRDIFTYRMTLNVRANTTLFVAVGYDFLANDFRLRLSRAGTTIVVGDPSGVENRNDYFNFYNLLYADVGPGTYTLDLVDDLRNKNFDFESYCHRFSFFLVAFAEELPSVNYVLPPGGTDLNPFRDMSVAVVFSETLQVPEGNLVDWITTRNAIYLMSGSERIFPYLASITAAGTSIEVTFSSSKFHISRSYTLHVNAPQFRTEGGVAFQPFTQTFVFAMSECRCNNRGVCDPSGGSLDCECYEGYAGSQCQLCAPGYHGIADECQKNTPCTPTSCNGHGKCNDTRGYPTCVCDYGYASKGQDMCSTCASGFKGYPNCTAQPDDSVRPTRCWAPLIPDNLDTYEYLGYNGELHLQGDYFIDVANQIHSTYFSLTEDSAFRIYVEPHWVDIDLWLYEVDKDGNIVRYIDNTISIDTEETMFHILKGDSEKPVYYLIRFRYYIWDHERTINCENFNLEMAIAPFTRAKELADKFQCGTKNVLPSPPAVQAGHEYNYSPNQDFFVVADTNVTEGPNYFWNWTFHLTPPPGKRAVIIAEVNYQFLVGDMSLLLEVGRRRNHCERQGGYAHACENGENAHNRNYVKQVVGAGHYTLWLYEPVPQNKTITKCSPFNINITVYYTDSEDNQFFCKGRVFPRSLNQPGFLDTQGYMHVQQDFLLDRGTAYFTLTQPSVFRVHATSNVNIDFTVVNNVTGERKGSSSFSYDPQLLLGLDSGVYAFHINSFMYYGIECPLVNLEAEIVPNTMINSTCPGQESLPQLGHIDVGFRFPPTPTRDPTTFIAFTNNQVIKEWTFTLDQVAMLEGTLDSEFVVAGLKLEVVFHVEGNRRVLGTNSFNRNFLRVLLDPATYTLRIIKPRSSRSGAPPNIPPCAPFNFWLSVISLADITEHPCLQKGEAIPTTFDSIRYLGSDAMFDYQASDYRVPDFADFNFRSEYITMTVDVPSVIRVYVEPHVIDIDIALFEQGKTHPVVDGGYGFNNEESFVYVLQPKVVYSLQLYFFKWSGDVPECPTFNMEVAILPVSASRLPVKVCPNGRSRFPPGFPPKGLPEVPYNYSSQTVGDDLYFQQVKGVPQMSHVYNFQISTPANFHAELGYFFISGDLMMKLVHVESGTAHYGKNELNGNFLNVVRMPPGNYTFAIYEVAPNVEEIFGCSHFTFEVSLKADAGAITSGLYSRMPKTLDTVGFLKLTDEVHLEGDFQLFDNDTEDTVSFTLRRKSLLRVGTSHYSNEMDAIFMILRDANNEIYSAFTGMLFENLDPGKYTLAFARPYFPSPGPRGRIVADIQLAISPYDKVKHDLKNPRIKIPDPCTDKGMQRFNINPEGFYQEKEDVLVISPNSLKTKYVIDRVPFKLTISSVVYFRVGDNFLLHDLDLKLTGTIKANGKKVEVWGQNARNMNEIHQVLPPGDYALEVISPQKFNITELAHCGIYTSRVIIQDESGEGRRVDCSTLDVIPWDLNSNTGGSVPFGGPIKRGALHLVGDSFLMPKVLGKIDSIRMSLMTTSILSVITRETYIGDIFFEVEKKARSMELKIVPTVSELDFYQHSALYVLDHQFPTAPGNFTLDLRYEPPHGEPCPMFALQIDVLPMSGVVRSLVCPTLVNEKFPAKKVVTSERGFYSEFVNSYFTGKTLNNPSNNGTFRYQIELTVKESSRIIANFGYNTLTNMYRLRLLRDGSDGKYEIGTGSVQMSTLGTGDTNVNQVLSGLLTNGTYYLEIVQKVFKLPLPVDSESVQCFPFTYDMRITPNNDLPYIPDIQPSMGFFMNPKQPLSVDLTFSTSVYSEGEQLNERNTGPITQAFYLMPTDNSTGPISPNSVSTTGKSATRWFLRFPSERFAPKKTYRLYLRPDILSNQKGDRVRLISTNLYTMIDTKCNNNGEFDSGYCFCKMGYAGKECDRCDINYENVDKDPKAPLDCRRKTGDLCFEDTCGCRPGISPCVPLGTCEAGVCTCYRRYAGKNCSQCAEGYINFEQGCIRIPSECPKCVHGTCDTKTFKCVCTGHFAGHTCDECAPGWTGENCDTASVIPPTPTPHSPGAVTLSVIIFVTTLVLIVATIGFLLYRRFGAVRRYMPVEGFGFESSEMSAFDDED